MPRRRIRHMNAYWLDKIIRTRELRKTIDQAVTKISRSRIKFDAIAFRGMSGALIAPVLALHLKKTLIMVRKRRNEGHSEHMVEGDISARTYIIVDDFIAKGETVRAIVERVGDFTEDNPAKCVGAYLTYSNQILNFEQLSKKAKLDETHE